ncbi:BrnT family toxin [Desulfococcaceae bacterium HSG7]|nr:BrnT family toxin [Desulfococcaceae bacterium HSG7]
MIQFEWNPEKAKQNFKKHKVCFEEAATVFYDHLSATFDDPNHSISELRLITVGFSSQGRLLVVSHTKRGKNVRIISARTATAHERRRHEES